MKIKKNKRNITVNMIQITTTRKKNMMKKVKKILKKIIIIIIKKKIKKKMAMSKIKQKKIKNQNKMNNFLKVGKTKGIKKKKASKTNKQ